MFEWLRKRFRKNESDSAHPLSQDVGFDMADEKVLIVGLGNPGRKYRGNRHNIGFMALDRIADAFGLVSDRVEHKAIVGKTKRHGKSVILAKPKTYMNESGNSVGPLAKYYKVPPDNVLVIYDELDLEFGTLRIRPKGSAAGHNGMRSIINHIGNEFPRVRLGIGRPPGKMPVHAWVLQDFRDSEMPTVDTLLDETVRAVETFLTDGVELAMSRHNGNYA